MRSVVREIISLAVGVPGIVMFGYGMNTVLDIGSCASGGSYAITRPCPEGTDAVFWLMVAGFLGWVAGILISKENFMGPGAGQFLWFAGFAGGGVALLVKVLTQSMEPDAKLGATIVAVTFIPMGLAVGILGIFQLVRKRRAPAGKQPRRPMPAAGTPAARDPWLRLKALNNLRSTGALTREEFDGLKAGLEGSEPEQTAGRVELIKHLADQRSSGALSAEGFEARKRDVLR